MRARLRKLKIPQGVDTVGSDEGGLSLQRRLFLGGRSSFAKACLSPGRHPISRFHFGSLVLGVRTNELAVVNAELTSALLFALLRGDLKTIHKPFHRPASCDFFPSLPPPATHTLSPAFLFAVYIYILTP